MSLLTTDNTGGAFSGDGAGGDIWSTGAFSFESPLKDLLDRGDYTVQQLLAEDELLQELRGVHPQLIEYFATEHAVTELIHHVICSPSQKKKVVVEKQRKDDADSDTDADAAATTIDTQPQKDDDGSGVVGAEATAKATEEEAADKDERRGAAVVTPPPPPAAAAAAAVTASEGERHCQEQKQQSQQQQGQQTEEDDAVPTAAATTAVRREPPKPEVVMKNGVSTNNLAPDDEAAATAATSTNDTTAASTDTSADTDQRKLSNWILDNTTEPIEPGTTEDDATATTTTAAEKEIDAEDEHLQTTVRFPYMACEIMCCEIMGVLNVLVEGYVPDDMLDDARFTSSAGLTIRQQLLMTTTPVSSLTAPTTTMISSSLPGSPTSPGDKNDVITSIDSRDNIEIVDNQRQGTKGTAKMTPATPSSPTTQDKKDAVDDDKEDGAKTPTTPTTPSSPSSAPITPTTTVVRRYRILDLFFSLLYTTPVGELDDYRAGYFDKILSVLFRLKSKEMALYLGKGESEDEDEANGNNNSNEKEEKKKADSNDDDDTPADNENDAASGGTDNDETKKPQRQQQQQQQQQGSLHGQDALIRAMIQHLYSHSIMQIVQRLLIPHRPVARAPPQQQEQEQQQQQDDNEAGAAGDANPNEADENADENELLRDPLDDDDEDEDDANGAGGLSMIQSEWSGSTMALNLLLDCLFGSSIGGQQQQQQHNDDDNANSNNIREEQQLSMAQNASEVLITIIQNSMLSSTTMLMMTSTEMLRKLIDAVGDVIVVKKKPKQQQPQGEAIAGGDTSTVAAEEEEEKDEEYFSPHESLQTCAMNVLESLILQLGGYGAVGTMSLLPEEEMEAAEAAATAANEETEADATTPAPSPEDELSKSDDRGDVVAGSSNAFDTNDINRKDTANDVEATTKPTTDAEETPQPSTTQPADTTSFSFSPANAPDSTAAPGADSSAPTTNTAVEEGEEGIEMEHQQLAASTDEANSEDGQLIADLSSLLEQLPYLLDRLAYLLTHPSTKRWKSPSQLYPTKPLPLLGTSRLRIVRVLESLVLLGDNEIDQLLIQSDCLYVCLNLFWQFQWCSMLHQSVANLLVHVFEGQNARYEMQEYFLVRCNLLGRLMDSFLDEVQPDGTIRHHEQQQQVLLDDQAVMNMKDNRARSSTNSSDVSDRGSGSDILPVSEDDVEAALEQQQQQQEQQQEETRKNDDEASPPTKSQQQLQNQLDASVTSASVTIEAPAQSFRLGYMGHVIIICQALVHACTADLDDGGVGMMGGSGDSQEEDPSTVAPSITPQQQVSPRPPRPEDITESAAATAPPHTTDRSGGSGGGKLMNMLESAHQQSAAGASDGQRGGSQCSSNSSGDRSWEGGGASSYSQDGGASYPLSSGYDSREPLYLALLVNEHPLCERWHDFITTTLASETAIQSTPLGGYATANALMTGDPLHAHRPGLADDGDVMNSGAPSVPSRGGAGETIDMDENDLDVAATMMANMNIQRNDDDSDGSFSSGDSERSYNSGETNSEQGGYLFDDPLGKDTSGLGVQLGSLTKFMAATDAAKQKGEGGISCGSGSRNSKDNSQNDDDSSHSSSSDEEPDRRESEDSDVQVMNLFVASESTDQDHRPSPGDSDYVDDGGFDANFDDAFAASSAPSDEANSPLSSKPPPEEDLFASFGGTDAPNFANEAAAPTGATHTAAEPFASSSANAGDVDEIFGKGDHANLLEEQPDPVPTTPNDAFAPAGEIDDVFGDFQGAAAFPSVGTTDVQGFLTPEPPSSAPSSDTAAEKPPEASSPSKTVKTGEATTTPSPAGDDAAQVKEDFPSLVDAPSDEV